MKKRHDHLLHLQGLAGSLGGDSNLVTGVLALVNGELAGVAKGGVVAALELGADGIVQEDAGLVAGLGLGLNGLGDLSGQLGLLGLLSSNVIARSLGGGGKDLLRVLALVDGERAAVSEGLLVAAIELGTDGVVVHGAGNVALLLGGGIAGSLGRGGDDHLGVLALENRESAAVAERLLLATLELGADGIKVEGAGLVALLGNGLGLVRILGDGTSNGSHGKGQGKGSGDDGGTHVEGLAV